MAKIQVWNNKYGKYQERNPSANRICANCIRKNFGVRKFTLSEMQEALGVDRKTAWNWLYSLRQGRFVNSGKIGPRRMFNNRWYQLSPKGVKKLPRRKDKKPESKIQFIEKPVQVTKKLHDEIIGER
ncbi:MAG: hypothetical protein ABIB79_03460 [archaeon]